MSATYVLISHLGFIFKDKEPGHKAYIFIFKLIINQLSPYTVVDAGYFLLNAYSCINPKQRTAAPQAHGCLCRSRRRTRLEQVPL